jgi:hypothetical protein
VRRYTDHFYDQLTVPAFVAQQRADLQTAASLLQAQMRGGDELMLQTCHLPQEAEIVTFVDALNGNTLEVARTLSLPLFDEAYLVGRWVNHTEEGDLRVACPREYLGYGDGVHQGLEANLLIVAELERWAREGSSPNVLRPQAD